MKKNYSTLLSVLLIILIEVFAFTSFSQQLAFPGAEGFGRYATGGRGGAVYHVTNLNDNGSGSFRDAVSQPNRIVVFDVGGVINLAERVVVSNNITIAGQTAPGDGVTIYGNGLSFSGADNTICRYLRVRMGKNGDDGKDAMSIANGTTMIFDHVSTTWGRDETFSINWDSKGVEPTNITIQHSIIGQGLETHSCGGLIQTSGGVSLIKNLYIDNDTRNPKVKGVNQYVNNIIYNWGSDGYILGDSEGQSFANVIGNYFITGPSTSGAAFTRGNLNFNLYAADNYRDNNKNGILDGSVLVQTDYTTVTWVTTPYDYPPISTLTPLEAYNLVVSDAGASIPVRDEVDQRLIEELTSLGTLGELIMDETAAPMNGPGLVKGGKASIDSDGDGMPDEWEYYYGMNPYSNSNQNTDLDGDGYTNVEEYLNATDPGKDTGILSDRTYFILPRHSEKALDIKDKNISEGTEIVQNTQYKVSRQIWNITHVGENYFSIINDSSNLCMDVQNQSSEDSALIIQAEYTSAESQQWSIDFLGEGYYKITNKASGKSLDVLNGSLADDNSLIQTTFMDSSYQQFKMMPSNLFYSYPFLNVTAPLGGSIYTLYSTIAIEVFADDFDGVVARVEFYDGTTKIGSDSIAPYEWQIDSATSGVHQISAKVYDDDNLSTPSAAVAITIVNAGGSPCTIQENTTGFCKLDGTVDNNNGGFTGYGFANTDNAAGKGIDWKVNIPVAGQYSFTWRYANQSGNRTAKLLVNGTELISTIDMPATGSFTTWNIASVTASLPSGILEIRLEANTSGGLANIDFMEVSGNESAPAACGPTGIPEHNQLSVNLYPNPVMDELTIDLNQDFPDGCKLSLYNTFGQVMKTANIENKTYIMDVRDIQEGIYFIKIEDNNHFIVTRLLKL